MPDPQQLTRSPWAASSDDFIDLALQLSGARTSDLVCVAGPGALPALMRLYDFGFQNAECVWRATCPIADRPRDLLMLTGHADAQALGKTVRLTGKLLRDGGLLVTRLAAAADAAAIAPALASVGRAGAASGALLDLVALRVTRRNGWTR